MFEDKRENILHAATDVFSKYGFHGAKMEDIAREANIGKGTIYGYFNSKESLFYEMIKHGIKEYEKGLNRALGISQNLEKQIYALCQFHGEYINKYIGITQIIMMEKEVLSKELMKDIMDEKIGLFNRVQNAVDKAICSGEIKDGLDSELAAIMIIGSINQFYGQKICYEKMNHKAIDPKDLIEMILKGLK
jgi:AcrR family transcriptional regulator